MKNPEEVVDHLQERGYLIHGNTLRKELFEELLDLDYTNDWLWLGPFLGIKNEIEARGFFCTTRGQAPGDLFLLGAEEMAYRCRQINKNVGKRLNRAKESMVSADISDLLEEEQRRHMHEVQKIVGQLNAWRNPLSNI